MGVDVSTSIVIARPIAEVAALSGDPARAPDWYVNIVGVNWKTPPPMVIGSRLEFTAQFLGRKMTYTYEVVEHAPNERLVMRTAEGPFPMETIYTWEALGPGETKMTLRNRGEPRGFARIMKPFMKLAMRRANTKDLRRLKTMLEAEKPAPS